MIPEAEDALHQWVADGEIKILENVTVGLERAGEAYSNMMKGETIGKNLVKVEET